MSGSQNPGDLGLLTPLRCFYCKLFYGSTISYTQHLQICQHYAQPGASCALTRAKLSLDPGCLDCNVAFASWSDLKYHQRVGYCSGYGVLMSRSTPPYPAGCFDAFARRSPDMDEAAQYNAKPYIGTAVYVVKDGEDVTLSFVRDGSGRRSVPIGGYLFGSVGQRLTTALCVEMGKRWPLVPWRAGNPPSLRDLRFHQMEDLQLGRDRTGIWISNCPPKEGSIESDHWNTAYFARAGGRLENWEGRLMEINGQEVVKIYERHNF